MAEYILPSQSFDSNVAESKPVQRRGNIDTGRSGGIGSAISAFNQAQSPTESAPLARVNFELLK